MKKNAALYVIVLLFADVSAAKVNAGATISDRRYWPNEARASPGQILETSPPYTYQRACRCPASRASGHREWQGSIDRFENRLSAREDAKGVAGTQIC